MDTFHWNINSPMYTLTCMYNVPTYRYSRYTDNLKRYIGHLNHRYNTNSKFLMYGLVFTYNASVILYYARKIHMFELLNLTTV